MTPHIKRELRRRSAVEPVIGHLKSEHRMGRNYLWHRHGDANNARHLNRIEEGSAASAQARQSA
jgi:hypothetical protein